MKTTATLKRLLDDVRAATTIEYGLILAMVFLGMVGAAVALGNEDTSLWNRLESQAVAAMSGN